jgi:SRSO17 transposase
MAGDKTPDRPSLPEKTEVIKPLSTTMIWAPGMERCRPCPGKADAVDRPAACRDPDHAPVSAKQLALSLPNIAWKTISWREGTRHPLRSRFARVRIRPAHRDHKIHQPREQEWLMIE